MASKVLLIAASLFFYCYWDFKYLPILLLSLLVNYGFGWYLIKHKSKPVFWMAIAFDLSLLGYFKYANFFIENVSNTFFDGQLLNPKIVLPLAISFFTFQKIAYISDCMQGKLRDRNFLNYTLFVTFFPQLIAGPIVHHKDIIPQFKTLRTKFINYNNIALGIFIFAVGLFKKVIIADHFAIWANSGFSHYADLSTLDAWKTSLSYTAQLYFDFSGYTDMAIGSALLFNIKLPFNFNQPYKSLNIREFWQRWHMTLSKFLKDYLYIPLGGNRVSGIRIYVNLMIVFLISGLWHGAGWTFIFWGFLHGAAICLHHFYSRFGFSMNKILAWFLTFNFINISWVFFRADHFNQAVIILQKMFGFNSDRFGIMQNWEKFTNFVRFNDIEYLILVFVLFLAYKLLPFITKDAEALTQEFKHNNKYKLATICLLVIPILAYHKTSEFLYFNF